ncbi:uncharacterized protein LOC123448680 [Hordeum vulgare subsp. vulgare]|uniref:Predicted protein n=1 Tax=Hordeum vulgare subsp. vulgare TaxID=112509 RepID=F2EDF1_HORVV|nr:uncharacterized protein LOC123448680 [Hordeum vulgare subsp. vulgare]BAK05373.1 predicted protein [Hordeum vulgare subsp. vulgare]
MVTTMLNPGDLLPASCDKAVSVLAAFASSEGEQAPISTRKASAHRPRVPHSRSLALTPSQRPLPLQHLVVGRIRDGLDLLLLAAGARPSPYFYLLQSCCTLQLPHLQCVKFYL